MSVAHIHMLEGRIENRKRAVIEKLSCGFLIVDVTFYSMLAHSYRLPRILIRAHGHERDSSSTIESSMCLLR